MTDTSVLPAAHPRVQARRMALLRMLADGCGTLEMAARMRLSERTVKGHLAELFTAIGARSRAHAVGIAYREGLLPIGKDYPPATPEVVVRAVAAALSVDLARLPPTVTPAGGQ